jgi:ketol-acid reductoisomerase
MSEGGKGAASRDRVALLGYGPESREQALRLRALGWEVDVVMRPGGMSWIRAVTDGFRPVTAAEAAGRADVVVIHLPEAEQPAVWAYGVAPYLSPGSLVVFMHGWALYSGAVDPDPGLDVVLVTGRDDLEGAELSCRVAVHGDATGHALERAASFARALYGAAKIGTTTLDAEVKAELSEVVARMGSLEALLAEWDRVIANPSHEPDEATLTYYERLRAVVVAGDRSPAAPRSQILPTRLSSTRRPRTRGAA